MSSLTDALIEEALAEVYTLAADEVLLDTLEARHSTFTDENGNPAAVRLVRDCGDPLPALGDVQATGHLLTLELSAPMDAGQTVPFLGCAFDFTPPRQDDGGIPTMDMAIDNAAALLSEKLDAIVEASDPLEITYRQFFASDKTHPQYVLGGMMGQAASSNLSRVTITAGFADLYNKPYPPDKYSPDDYVTLAV